jgi:hypothetical protein
LAKNAKDGAPSVFIPVLRKAGLPAAGIGRNLKKDKKELALFIVI